MISKKTVAILLFIILNMQIASSSSRGAKRSRSTTLQLRRRKPASKPQKMLKDTNVNMDPVEVPVPKRREHESETGGSVPKSLDMTSMMQAVEAIKEGNEEMDISQELSIALASKEMEELINQKRYDKVFEFVENMDRDEFLKQLCLAVKTPEQYKGIVDRLKDHRMVVSFYVHGDINIVKEAIFESSVYDKKHYNENGDLETALPLALKMNLHDRFVDFLKIRQERWRGNFGDFVCSFLVNFAPEKNGMALKRFLTVKEEELRKESPDIIDTLCQELVNYLRTSLHEPKAEKFLIDVVGQPSILTPVSFLKGFLRSGHHMNYSNFIKYGWREAILEGMIDEEHSMRLWNSMMRALPNRRFRTLPGNLALEQFPAKQQKEKEWIKANEQDFLVEVERVSVDILPIVLVSLIVEYAGPTWDDNYILNLLEKAEPVINDILPKVLVPVVLGYIESA